MYVKIYHNINNIKLQVFLLLMLLGEEKLTLELY